METKKAIENRRSIRSFKNDEISKEVVEDILNCARLAPSAKNRQPWYFVVLKGEMKNKVADMMIEFTANNDLRDYYKKIDSRSSINPTANVIKQASILILVFREKDKNWVVGDNLSIGACVENICLRATDLGLGSLWIRDTVHVAEDIAKMVGHEDLEMNCAIALGVPNENPNPRPRKELKDIVEWY